VEETVRTHRREEERIADRSITLLRNRKGVIPINPDARTLVIEWEKVQATMLFSSASEIYYMEPAARQFLSNVDFELLKLASPADVETGAASIPPSLRNRLKQYDFIIAGLYSRSPAIEAFQAGAVKEIFAEREDVVVVAMGNPYDIRNFPSVHNYVVTYGFRRVQMEALLKVLTGKIAPSGRLPVQIRGLFPREYAFNMDESGVGAW
jgi:beta-N-acetylhexosaminidase